MSRIRGNRTGSRNNGLCRVLTGMFDSLSDDLYGLASAIGLKLDHDFQLELQFFSEAFQRSVARSMFTCDLRGYRMGAELIMRYFDQHDKSIIPKSSVSQVMTRGGAKWRLCIPLSYCEGKQVTILQVTGSSAPARAQRLRQLTTQFLVQSCSRSFLGIVRAICVN